MPTPWYDTWKTTPPEPKVFAECEICGSEIYSGCEYVEVDGTILCEESDCFEQYAKNVLDPTTKYAD